MHANTPPRLRAEDTDSDMTLYAVWLFMNVSGEKPVRHNAPAQDIMPAIKDIHSIPFFQIRCRRT
jgi:hypothetical protein